MQANRFMVVCGDSLSSISFRYNRKKIASTMCLAGPGGDFGICGGGHIEDCSLLAMIQPRLNLFVVLPGDTVVFQL